MAESAPPKLQTQIEIKPPQEKEPRTQEQEHRRAPFFKSRGRRRRSDTWIISVFVILHVVAFITTMAVNDCWKNSHGDCAFKALGRLSFQPLSENPLLGPSASALDEMGALRQTFLEGNRHNWRLFTCPWLHAGFIHLVINLGSIVFVGIHLEKEFGPLRIGIIYTLSAFVGSLIAALFVRDTPAVGASGALFGLLGAMLSGLIRNWNFYTDKFAAIVLLVFVSAINFAIGLLPYVDNFSSIGGFISGMLLGFTLLFTPRTRIVAHSKAGLFEYSVKSSMNFKLKLDRPIMRSASLLLFVLVILGCLVAVFRGININRHCKWCKYVDCVPSKRWSCNDITTNCETMMSNSQLTMTCMSNGNFRVFSYTNISQPRMKDLCTLLCS
ncbi:Rhomboid-like protein [Melia azedarach]|uniref:Rhomboid-like protein n=1 Tax=Melia azedarach TaxID=155640 RepID=A0ACC1WS71_MELAZ|nr:Rhomboid-like protein [Melia azedarach]